MKLTDAQLVPITDSENCGRTRKDIAGQRFGRLVAIREAGRNRRGRVIWECHCDCGNVVATSVYDMESGYTQSCGCQKRDHNYETRKSLIGQRFGRLVVVAYAGTDRQYKCSKRLWECHCDCGRSTTLNTNRLTTGNTQSCGCIQEERRRPWNMGGAMDLFASYKQNAQSHNRAFEIDFYTTFLPMTQQPCCYCGATPSQVWKGRGRGADYMYNGIDRIDNSLGYVDGNCKPCCWACNNMRGKQAQLDFVLQVFKIAHHSIKHLTTADDHESAKLLIGYLLTAAKQRSVDDT